jgi:hypothetical protein
MSPACVTLLTIGLIACAWVRPAAGGPLPRLAVSVPSGVSAADVVRTLASAGIAGGLVVMPPMVARVGGGGTASEADAAPARLAEGATGADLVLHLVVQVGEVPGAGRDREAFVDARVSEILEASSLAAAAWKGLIVEVAGGAPSFDILQYAVAALIVRARGTKPGLQVTLMLPADLADASPDTARRLVAYADGLAVRGDAGAAVRGQRLAGGRPVTLKVSGPGSDAPASGSSAFLDALVAAGLPVAETFWVEAASAADLRSLCAAYRFLARSLGSGFQVTAAQRAPAALLVDGQPAGPSVAFVSSTTADVAFLLKAGGTRAAPRALSVAAGGEPPQVACYDAADGRRLPAGRDAGPAQGCAADATYAFVLVGRGGGQERLFEAVDVLGRAELSVEEIIARWQARREAERRLLGNYAASCLLNLHFQSGSFGIALDVALELRQFVDRTGVNDWVQTALLVNGVRLKGVREFPLPQLEPGRVVAKPLELGIDQKYRYVLAGTDTVNDRLSYVVDLEPANAGERLYSGRVWIDGETFRHVRMRLEQRAGLNNVASHVETQDFASMRDEAGREFTLFTKIFTSETLNLGGRPVMLERTYHFDQYAINTPGFAAALDEARRADRPMFRDTGDGLRALRKEGDALVVDDAPGKKVRALVGGVVVDASLPFPIPLAGMSWVDFDFRERGDNLSVVFAGLLLAVNQSRQRGPKLRTSVEFSLSALPSLLRVYEGDVELEGQQVRMFEQTAGAIVNYQATPALTLSASTHLALHPFMRTDETDPEYVTPSFGVNLRAWAEARYVRRSLQVEGLVEPVWRVTGWTPYGYEADGLETPPRGYIRYDVEMSQHLYTGKLARGGVSAAYYGGGPLDRFSRYQSSFLVKPRIVGIPSGVDSFDAIGLAGVYYGFNVMDLFKLEASYNHAWARNASESSAFRQFDGMDFDIGTAGPWGTYLQGAVAFTLRGNLDRYESRWGAQVLVFKPLSK